MLDTDLAFRPVQRREGYLPLEDLSLIGDGASCAPVGLDGAIHWMCVPHFDSEPLFCGLLEGARGGHFTIAPDDVVAARQRAEVAVHFRPVPHLPFTGVGDPAANVLRFGHDPETLSLELTGAGPGPSFGPTPLTLDARLDPPVLPACGRLSLDVLNGDPTLSIRDEAEESWRIVEPVMVAWSRDLVPLEGYPAGSEGPIR